MRIRVTDKEGSLIVLYGSRLGNLTKPYVGQVGNSKNAHYSPETQGLPMSMGEASSQRPVPRIDTCCPVTIAAASPSPILSIPLSS